MIDFALQCLQRGEPCSPTVWLQDPQEDSQRDCTYRYQPITYPMYGLSRPPSIIVKFKDLATGIHCDLNINDQLGSINTSLIQHYCDTLPVLRLVLLAIKRWARPLGYNSPAGAPGTPTTFSSYALTIMTIGLLQVPSICQHSTLGRHLLANFSQTRGLLPNLQEGDILPEGRTFWLRTRTQERIRCDARWKNAHYWVPPVVEVEQVLQDWFQ